MGDNEQGGQPAQVPVGLSMEDVEQRLAQRDERLLHTFSNVLAEAFQNYLPAAQSRDASVVREEAIKSGRVTREEFDADPVAAMEKFTNEKLAGLRPAGPDPAAALALIETNKRNFYDSLSEEERQYIPYFEQYILDLSPRALMTPQGLDTAWRLNRSFAQDFISAKEYERISRMEQAQLSQSGGRPMARQRVFLPPEEQAHAYRMGINPEDYANYSRPQIIDI